MKTMNKELGKEFLLSAVLLLFTVLINYPVYTAESMYQEQPIMYAANSKIKSTADLFNIYLHPKPIEAAAPFFRPTGDFLIYQMMTPIFGWHNQNAFFVLNFLILGLVGYFMIKLYDELFPGFKLGGYIAFAFYLMNPALITGHVTLMHFEFAYVMFLFAGLYSFVLFCKKNLKQQVLPINQIQFKHYGLLLTTVVCFFLAATAKESAILLGPSLMIYFFLSLYNSAQPLYVFKGLQNPQIRHIIWLFTLLTVTLAMYLTFGWSGATHPLRNNPAVPQVHEMQQSLGEFIRYLFSLSKSIFAEDQIFSRFAATRIIIMLPMTQILVWSLLALSLISLPMVFFSKNIEYKKSVIFLFISLLLFLAMPVFWSLGFPWHISLSLACEGLLLGFSFEWILAKTFSNRKLANLAGLLFALTLGLCTFDNDVSNLAYLSSTMEGFSRHVSYNAVYHPPALLDKLNKDSVLIVEDADYLGDYGLGNSTFPLDLTQGNKFDYNTFYHPDLIFLRLQPIYNGTLFRWAYLKPDLKEEVINFKLFPLASIPDNHLLSWLRQGDNIFAVTFDQQGNWRDDTQAFKKNLLTEQQRRHLTFHQYQQLPQTALSEFVAGTRKLNFPDAGTCQTICDSEKKCKGFTYIDSSIGNHFIAKCNFYENITGVTKPCQVCSGYIKAVV